MSSEKHAERINASLPIAVSSDGVEKSPEFAALMWKLTSRLTPHGYTCQTAKKIEKAHNTMEKKRGEFLKQKAVYDPVKHILLDHELRSLQSKERTKTEKAFGDIRDVITRAEVADILHPRVVEESSGAVTTVLDLTGEDVRSSLTAKEIVNSVSVFLPVLHCHIKKICDEILNSMETFHLEDSVGVSGSSMRLGQRLREEVDLLKECTNLLLDMRRDKNKQVESYSSTLCLACETLKVLLERHMMHTAPAHIKSSTDNLQSQCETMLLKIRVTELNILVKTYTRETAIALNIIRVNLDHEKRKARDSLNRKMASLQVYESVGSNFNTLVQEYTTLRKEIQNLKWVVENTHQDGK